MSVRVWKRIRAIDGQVTTKELFTEVQFGHVPVHADNSGTCGEGLDRCFEAGLVRPRSIS